MQNQKPSTGSSENPGFFYSTLIRFMVLFSRKTPWIIAGIFCLCVVVGYWLGTKLVVTSEFTDLKPVQSVDSQSRVVTLIEVTDLTEPQPALLSVWFIHLMDDEKPVLGFTPVYAISMLEDGNLPVLSDFSLDSNGNPSGTFLKSLNKLNVRSSGYILVDHISASAFINWINGTELDKPLDLTNHSMAEYGQILRTMCGSLPADAEKGMSEFPWSKFTPAYFRTSLPFSQVIENTGFLFANGSPRCEMVPLP